MKKKIVI